MHRIVESLYCTPESNITLYINYIGIKIKKKTEKNVMLNEKNQQTKKKKERKEKEQV